MKFTRELNRLDPKMPPGAYKTYGFVSPLSTHYRPASCEEVGCLAFRQGWVTRVPAGSDLEATVRRSGRRIAREGREPGHVLFTFAPGTKCFAASKHRISLDRPPVFYQRGGDWRQRIGDVQKMNGRDWLDDFANHQQRLADRKQEG